MSLVSFSLHTPVALISDQCDDQAGSTLVTGWKTGSRRSRVIISSNVRASHQYSQHL